MFCNYYFKQTRKGLFVCFQTRSPQAQHRKDYGGPGGDRVFGDQPSRRAVHYTNYH
jgi:hypothetical protein